MLKGNARGVAASDNKRCAAAGYRYVSVIMVFIYGRKNQCAHLFCSQIITVWPMLLVLPSA